MQKLKARVRFNTAKERFEKFSESMYFIYLPFEEDDDSVEVVKGIISQKLFVPLNQVSYMGKDARNDWLFVIG